MLLTITPAVGAPLQVVREDGVDTGYRVLASPEWGNAVWEMKYSGQRGTQGARAAGAIPANRPVVIPLRCYGTTGKDQLADRVGALQDAAARLRRFGGLITVRSTGQTYRQSFVVLGGQVAVKAWGRRAENANIADTVLEAACAPYLLGDAMDVLDGFATDTVTAGDWTLDAGTTAQAVVAAGVLTPSATSLTTERRLAHTVRGYVHAGAQATVKATPGATITSYRAGVILRRSSSSTYVAVYVDDTGAASRLRVDVVIAGVVTNRATVNLAARVSAATPLWVRGRIEGGVVYAEHFTSAPTPMGAATTASPSGGAGYTLTATEQAALVNGTGGITWTPQDAAATVDDFELLPFTRRSMSLPDTMALEATVPGDARALADVSVTASGGALPPVWAMLAWAERPAAYNLVANGDLEDDADGWSAAAVAGITGAATSATRVTSAGRAKYGTASLQVVTPATANTGATYAIARRFRKGITYTAVLYASSAAATTLTRARLGVSGDVASETPAALSTTVTARTVTWTPTADVDVAYVAFEVTAATATTMNLDAVMVYEGATVPTLGRHAEGAGAMPPFGILDAGLGEDSGDTTTWASTFDGAATTRGSYYLTASPAGAATLTAGWWIDPHLLVADDYTLGELDLEVWGRVYLASTLVTPRLTVSARPERGTSYGAERYTAEWGSLGATLTAPTASGWRMVRLGTITLPVDASRPSRWKLRLTGATSTGSTGVLAVDYLVVCPIRNRAASPTGKPLDATFPAFIASTSETTKLVASDLRGFAASPPYAPAPDAGLDGALLELPQGATDVLVKLASLVPDDTAGAVSEQLAHTATVHVAVTPRYHLLRGTG